MSIRPEVVIGLIKDKDPVAVTFNHKDYLGTITNYDESTNTFLLLEEKTEQSLEFNLSEVSISLQTGGSVYLF